MKRKKDTKVTEDEGADPIIRGLAGSSSPPQASLSFFFVLFVSS